MVSNLPPLAFSILVIQYLFVALGIGALVSQFASSKAPTGLPTWNAGAGMFGLFAVVVMCCFFAVSTMAVLPFISFPQGETSDGIVTGVPAISPTILLGASIITQIVVPVVIFFLLKAFAPGYAFNFPEIRVGRLFQWKLGFVLLGCFATVGLAGFVVSQLQVLLDHAVGMKLVWDKQEIMDVFLKNRDNPILMSLAFLTAVVGAPIWEELFFRGCVYRFFKGIENRHMAAAITGTLFALIHFNAVAFIPLALLGAYLCHVYERTGDIRVPIVVHALFNLNSFLIMLLAPELHDIF
ncbi:MAG: CPBP family intramembrane metalloprotease [Puniceicoccales bacterium]|jgi:membrane protease YdiL (CAAX protease family)|nr:CPBP family intramembrane metalloprotease [Puniceicoccales bacterium]